MKYKFGFTQHHFSLKNSAGNTLIELLTAITVFSLFVVVLISSVLSLGTIQIKSESRLTATRLAQQAIEIAYNLSAQNWTDFSSLPSGVYHPKLDGGHYTLDSGDQLIDEDYTRELTLEPAVRDGSGNISSDGGSPDPNTIKVTSKVTWTVGEEPEIITLTTFLINPNPLPTLGESSTNAFQQNSFQNEDN